MHFGQYAFGLFQRMYLDEIENAGKPGWPLEPSIANTRHIPAAILEYNLFGVDIDPRVIQISSLSLLLTAKEAAVKLGFSPLDVKIQRSNLVVANAVDLGAERLQALVEDVMNRQGAKGTQEIEVGERLFKTIWENLLYIGELGSLVQVREGVERVLEDWVDARAKEKGLTKLVATRVAPQASFEFIDEQDRERARQLDLERRVLESEARQLQQELLTAIEEAAGQIGGDPTERLFAEDTARGLKLLQILSRHYDVVVMNPPYGAFVPKVKDFRQIRLSPQLQRHLCDLHRPGHTAHGDRGLCRCVGFGDFYQPHQFRKTAKRNPAQAKSAHRHARSWLRYPR